MHYFETLFKTRYLRAFTLSELLIVMIISGIILFSAFEGISLIRRHTNRLSSQFNSGQDILTHYRLLEAIIARSDSLHTVADSLLLYRQGNKPLVLLHRGTSFIIAYPDFPERADTLFREVSAIRTASRYAYGKRSDTLFIHLEYSGKAFTLSFTLPESNPDIISPLN